VVVAAALILMPLLAPVGEPHHLMFLLWPIASVSDLSLTFRSSTAKNKKAHDQSPTALLVDALAYSCPWVDHADQSLWNMARIVRLSQSARRADAVGLDTDYHRIANNFILLLITSSGANGPLRYTPTIAVR